MTPPTSSSLAGVGTVELGLPELRSGVADVPTQPDGAAGWNSITVRGA